MKKNALPILRNQKSITLRMDSIKAAKSDLQVKMLVKEEDAPLLSALKAKRGGLAKAEVVPAYVVFNNKTLFEMAHRKLTNIDDMASINGVGAKKLESCGVAFLEVITGDFQRVHSNLLKLAGADDGIIFDLILEAQSKLFRGLKGANKALSCSTSLLAKISKLKPQNIEQLSQILGQRKTKRFGTVFLDVLAKLH